MSDKSSPYRPPSTENTQDGEKGRKRLTIAGVAMRVSVVVLSLASTLLGYIAFAFCCESISGTRFHDTTLVTTVVIFPYNAAVILVLWLASTVCWLTYRPPAVSALDLLPFSVPIILWTFAMLMPVLARMM